MELEGFIAARRCRERLVSCRYWPGRRGGFGSLRIRGDSVGGMSPVAGRWQWIGRRGGGSRLWGRGIRKRGRLSRSGMCIVTVENGRRRCIRFGWSMTLGRKGAKMDPCLETRRRKYNRVPRESERAPLGAKLPFNACSGCPSRAHCSGRAQVCLGISSLRIKRRCPRPKIKMEPAKQKSRLTYHVLWINFLSCVLHPIRKRSYPGGAGSPSSIGPQTSNGYNSNGLQLLGVPLVVGVRVGGFTHQPPKPTSHRL
jgi:hypothetical protein